MTYSKSSKREWKGNRHKIAMASSITASEDDAKVRSCMELMELCMYVCMCVYTARLREERVNVCVCVCG